MSTAHRPVSSGPPCSDVDAVLRRAPLELVAKLVRPDAPKVRGGAGLPDHPLRHAHGILRRAAACTALCTSPQPVQRHVAILRENRAARRDGITLEHRGGHIGRMSSNGLPRPCEADGVGLHLRARSNAASGFKSKLLEHHPIGCASVTKRALHPTDRRGLGVRVFRRRRVPCRRLASVCSARAAARRVSQAGV